MAAAEKVERLEELDLQAAWNDLVPADLREMLDLTYSSDSGTGDLADIPANQAMWFPPAGIENLLTAPIVTAPPPPLVTSSPVPSNSILSNMFATPTGADVVTHTPMAPKRAVRARRLKHNSRAAYGTWTLEQLQEEFCRRFDPDSQKRLQEKSFLVWRLMEDDQTKDTAAALASLEKTIDQVLESPPTPADTQAIPPPHPEWQDYGNCKKCKAVWHWTHFCSTKPMKRKFPSMWS